jgi:hypothetical protein
MPKLRDELLMRGHRATLAILLALATHFPRPRVTAWRHRIPHNRDCCAAVQWPIFATTWPSPPSHHQTPASSRASGKVPRPCAGQAGHTTPVDWYPSDSIIAWRACSATATSAGRSSAASEEKIPPVQPVSPAQVSTTAFGVQSGRTSLTSPVSPVARMSARTASSAPSSRASGSDSNSNPGSSSDPSSIHPSCSLRPRATVRPRVARP